jgi:molecular chaperone GrpE (heat shock protein)
MNKIRRNELERIANQLSDLQEALQEVQAEEETVMENMPENLQGSERYEKAEEAVDLMQTSYDMLDEIMENLNIIVNG